MARTCMDPSMYYDELIRTCVNYEPGDGPDGPEEQVVTPAVNTWPLVSPTVPSKMGPHAVSVPPVISPMMTPSPEVIPGLSACGAPLTTVSPPPAPSGMDSSPRLPMATYPPPPAAFPVMAVVVTFSVATLLWLVILFVLLWWRRVADKKGNSRSIQALEDQLEKGSLTACMNFIPQQSGREEAFPTEATAPPFIPVAIQCSTSNNESTDHAFPLPATDLGAAILVTTKTLQSTVDIAMESAVR
ncbi:tumor necrosis factor receptor superfamily member 13C [Lissotriton helveticus]